MSTYTTVLGDTWDMIAYNVLNDTTRAKELVEANLNYVTTVIFSAGVVLNVPDITASITDTSSLPPWKRGNTNAST